MKDKKWTDISEGMPVNVPCEVMQEGGKVSIAAYIITQNASGINLLDERECGEFYRTNKFLMKVEKFRPLT